MISNISFKELVERYGLERATEIFREGEELSRRLIDMFVTTGKVDMDTLKKIADIDPTGNKKYVPWLVKMYIKDKESFDFDHLISIIPEFDALVKSGYIEPQDRDINRFKSVQELIDVVNDANNRKSASVSSLSKDFEIVRDDEDFLIVVPHSHEASRKLGLKYFSNFERGDVEDDERNDCTWCTTFKTSAHWNNYYNKQILTLYYILARNPDIAKKLKARVSPYADKMAVVVYTDGRFELWDGDYPKNKRMDSEQVKAYMDITGYSNLMVGDTVEVPDGKKGVVDEIDSENYTAIVKFKNGKKEVFNVNDLKKIAK